MGFSHIHRKLALRTLQALNSPRALMVWLLIEHEEWGQLVSLKTDPAHYLDSESFFKAYQSSELFRKCAGLPTGIDTKEVAVKGFEDAEKHCYLSNRILSKFVHNGPFKTTDLAIANFFDDVKKEIASILGGLPSELHGKFGPGATFSTSSRNSTICDKMQQRPTSTLDASPFTYFWKETAWYRSLCLENPNSTEPEFVRGNRFTTVPKDATKDRGIAVEPSLNGFYQLALGRHIRGRLLRVGLDLEEGQDVHRRMAREASSKGTLSTIDLSSASDTICHNLVKLLLPEQWYLALSSLRCPFTRVGEDWHYLEKFSSMGNGFTFELETLIFAALTRCAVKASGGHAEFGDNIFTYGDDIICPTQYVRSVLGVLRFCGFTPNDRKTFTSGYFRESCGGDFFNGENVTPFRIKELPAEPAQWIVLSNQLRATSLARYGVTLWESVRGFCHDQIPVGIRRCKGPAHLGDLVIHSDDERSWTAKWVDGIRYLSVFKPVSHPVPLRRWRPGVQFAAALYGVPSDGPTIRGSVRGYRIGWVAFS